MNDLKDKMRAAFEAQQNACDLLGSPLTRDVVRFCADDVEAGGIIGALVRGWQGDALSDNVPLRLAGFAHFQALSGYVAFGVFRDCQKNAYAFAPARNGRERRAEFIF